MGGYELDGIEMKKDTFKQLPDGAKLDAIFDTQVELSHRQDEMAKQIEDINQKLADKGRIDKIIVTAISVAGTALTLYVKGLFFRVGKP